MLKAATEPWSIYQQRTHASQQTPEIHVAGYLPMVCRSERADGRTAP